MGTILGLDWGQKKVGFATADDRGIVVTPRGSFIRKGIKKEEIWTLVSDDVAQIKKLIEKFEIEKIVLGYPLTQLGKSGPAAKGARSLSREIQEATQLEIVLIDEHLSSWEARGDSNEDAGAAAVLLRDYFQAKTMHS